MSRRTGMLERFRKHIRANSLCSDDDRILLAVSGGIDSVVMTDLFAESGFSPGLAHCNFGLRGGESDGDEAFAASLAEQYSMEFHVRRFPTAEVAERDRISIQMAARNLRYEWFEELRESCNYTWIATAHNQDDVLETFFINLSRGTGIRGLTGIPPRAGRVIRPLLFAPRKDIAEYADRKGLAYREDSSNDSDKYLRNRIRHHLIPMLEEQNPSFRKSLMGTMSKLAGTEKIFIRELGKIKDSVLERREGKILVKITELERDPSMTTILYEILSDFNFPSATIESIGKSLGGNPGKQFYSPTHRLVKDREELIITPLPEDEQRRVYLELGEGGTSEPISLDWEIVENTPKLHIPGDPHIACLDLDLLDFPLILRHRQAGDYFHPFGMNGRKKISDFLIDEKLSLPDKENVWLLASGPNIVWVIGHRIDDRFRITEKTRHVLMIRLQDIGLQPDI